MSATMPALRIAVALLALVLLAGCRSDDITALPEATRTDLSDPARTEVLLLGSGSLNAGSVDDDGAFEQNYLAPIGFKRVDWVDVEITTPSLATLQGYHAVIVYTNVAPADPVALGDRLADYVDGGGGVVFGAWAHTSSWGVAGRIQNPGYSPYNFDGSNPNTFRNFGSIARPGHPLLTGVTDVGSQIQENPTLAGGTVVVSWNTGEPAVAYNSGGAVVGITLSPGDTAMTGDYAILVSNALRYAAAH